MININKISSVYLIGIGGIGMSALAQYFFAEGCKVSGFDKMHSKVANMLENKGITVHYDENIQHMSHNPDLIIYTPAIPADNIELKYALENFEHVYKRSVVLQEVIKDMYCIAVAGTHGKTTISSMIAHILNYADMKANAFVGGLCKNINNNIYYHKGTKLVVVEADEYDKSFLQLNPDIAIVNSLDADHMDIYSTYENMVDAYVQFTSKTNKSKRLINEKCKDYFDSQNTYGFSDDASFKVVDYEYKNGLLDVTISNNDNEYTFTKLNVFGKFNIENLCAALFVACKLRVNIDKVEDAMRHYKGVSRRFDVRYKDNDIIIIDDYAHHPVEIDNFREALREVYKDKSLCAIFQPHLFSRTRDFMDELAQSLAKFDGIYLLNIYPAREEPIEGITSNELANRINAVRGDQLCKVVKKKEASNVILSKEYDVFTTIGAGDIDKIIDIAEKKLKNQI